MLPPKCKGPVLPYIVPVLRLLLVLLTPLASILACQTVSLQNFSQALAWIPAYP